MTKIKAGKIKGIEIKTEQEEEQRNRDKKKINNKEEQRQKKLDNIKGCYMVGQVKKIQKHIKRGNKVEVENWTRYSGSNMIGEDKESQ